MWNGNLSVSKIDFFSDYWYWLEENGCKNLVLHSWEDYPDKIPSDVDYAVSGVSVKEHLRMLRTYCGSRGWSLIQAIEHEIDSFYMVCFQRTFPYDSLSLDVTWNYRAKGYDLIPNERLFLKRQRITKKKFYVPATEVEFFYKFLKGVVKRKNWEELEILLEPLFIRAPESCVRMVNNFLTERGEEGISEGNFIDVKTAFCRSRYLKEIRNAPYWRLSRWKLYLRKVKCPTGFILKFPLNWNCDQVEEVRKIITPGFRSANQFKVRFFPMRFLARIRSTLLLTLSDTTADFEITESGKSQDWLDASMREVLGFLETKVERNFKLVE